MLEPHQQLVLRGGLGERRDGKWAAFEVGVVEPRQNGKGAIITARELAGLYLFGEPLLTHTAHRFDTALEGFRRIRELIEGSRDLSRRVHKITEAHGQEAIELRNPTQRLLFKARAKQSGRGFSGDVVILDEAFWLLDLGSLLPTMSARPNPQLWYLSSAPLPRMESDILRRLCRRGRAATASRRHRGRLAYFEWAARVRADPDDLRAWDAEVRTLLDDPEAWRQANPGIGYRLAEEFIESERAAMSDEEFARERCGIYRDVLDAVEPELPVSDWTACEDLGSQPIDPVVLAFDVARDRSWGCIAVAAPSTAGGMHVELIDNRPGTGWMVERLIELRDRHRPRAVVCLPTGPAGGLLADCTRLGLVVGVPTRERRVRPVTVADWSRACGAAYDDVVGHNWRHLGQAALNKAVGHAVKRKTGESWVFDAEKVDISPLRAVALAAWVSVTLAAEPKVSDFIVI